MSDATLTLKAAEVSALARVPKASELSLFTEKIGQATRLIALHWDDIPLEVRAELRRAAAMIRDPSKRRSHSLRTWLRVGWIIARARPQEWVDYMLVWSRFQTTLEDALKREQESADRAFERFAKDPAMHAAHLEAVAEIEYGKGYTSAEVEALLAED